MEREPYINSLINTFVSNPEGHTEYWKYLGKLGFACDCEACRKFAKTSSDVVFAFQNFLQGEA